MAIYEGEMLATKDLCVAIGGDYKLLRDRYPDNPLLIEGVLFDGHSFCFYGPITEHTHSDYVDYQERLRETL